MTLLSELLLFDLLLEFILVAEHGAPLVEYLLFRLNGKMSPLDRQGHRA